MSGRVRRFGVLTAETLRRQRVGEFKLKALGVLCASAVTFLLF
jgi:hypothetical protein